MARQRRPRSVPWLLAFALALQGSDSLTAPSPSRGTIPRAQQERTLRTARLSRSIDARTVLQANRGSEEDGGSGNVRSGTSFSSWPSVVTSTIAEDPRRSIRFSLLMTLCGATLGPFLDAYHSAFGVLQYDHPIRWVLWGTPEFPALTTAWWVPELFGLAGFLIGWLYVLLDAVSSETNSDGRSLPHGTTNGAAVSSPTTNYAPRPSVTKILIGISVFTLQYWLSGILSYNGTDRTTILNVMSVVAAVGFVALDNTRTGFLTSTATAVGGPLIEVGLISLYGGYRYLDAGETGFFPLWILPVYFLGGPANGNLARGLWTALATDSTATATGHDRDERPAPCPSCNDTRCAPCPNCDGIGTYVAMGGRSVTCTSCNGRGFVMCRTCFDRYDEDPYDIERIRSVVSKMPD